MGGSWGVLCEVFLFWGRIYSGAFGFFFEGGFGGFGAGFWQRVLWGCVGMFKGCKGLRGVHGVEGLRLLLGSGF